MYKLLIGFILQQCSYFVIFQEGHIDMLSSDHSPTEPKLKLLDEGNFLKAWGGISSLQVCVTLYFLFLPFSFISSSSISATNHVVN